MLGVEVMDRIKCVAVGDRGVGTTSMLRAYARDEGTASEPGKAAEEGRFTRQVAVEEGTCELTLWDTTRLEDYSQTDVFIICYDVTLASSLASVIEKVRSRHAPASCRQQTPASPSARTVARSGSRS